MEENNVLEEDVFRMLDTYSNIVLENREENHKHISNEQYELENAVQNFRRYFIDVIENQNAARIINDESPIQTDDIFYELDNFLKSQIIAIPEQQSQLNERIFNSISELHTEIKDFLIKCEEEKATEPRNLTSEEQLEDTLSKTRSDFYKKVDDSEFNEAKFEVMIEQNLNDILYKFPTSSRQRIMYYLEPKINEITLVLSSHNSKIQENLYDSVNISKELFYSLEEGILAIYEPEKLVEYRDKKNIGNHDLNSNYTAPTNTIPEFNVKNLPLEEKISTLKRLNEQKNNIRKDNKELLSKTISECTELFEQLKKELSNYNYKVYDSYNIVNSYLELLDSSINSPTSLNDLQEINDIVEGKPKNPNWADTFYYSYILDGAFSGKTYLDILNFHLNDGVSMKQLAHETLEFANVPQHTDFSLIENEMQKKIYSSLTVQGKNVSPHVKELCEKYINEIVYKYQTAVEQTCNNIIPLENTDVEIFKSASNELLEKYEKENPQANEILPAVIETEKRQAQLEAERKAKEEEEKKAFLLTARKLKETAEKIAREKAELKAKEEAERKAREEAERKAKEEAEKKAREEAERKAKEEAEKKQRELNDKKDYFNNTFKEKTEVSNKYYIALDQLSGQLDSIDDAFERDVATLGLENTFSNIREIQASIVTTQANSKKFSEISNSVHISYIDEQKFNQLEQSDELNSLNYFTFETDSFKYLVDYPNSNAYSIIPIQDALERELKTNLIENLYTQTQEAMKQEQIDKYEAEKEKISNEKIGFLGRARKEAIKQAKLENLDIQIEIINKKGIPPMPKNYGMSDILCDLELYKDKQNIENLSGKLSKFYNGIHEIANKNGNSKIIENAQKKYEIEKEKNNLPISTEDNKKYSFWNRDKKKLEDLQTKQNGLKQYLSKIPEKSNNTGPVSKEVYNTALSKINDLNDYISRKITSIQDIKDKYINEQNSKIDEKETQYDIPEI